MTQLLHGVITYFTLDQIMLDYGFDIHQYKLESCIVDASWNHLKGVIILDTNACDFIKKY